MIKYKKLSDFYYFKHDSLTKDFCEHCIEKFKTDDRKKQGRTGIGVDLSIKQSTDINISQYDDWKAEDKIFYESLSKGLEEYRDFHKESLKWLNIEDYEDSGYQIQETLPGGFYTWHHDFYSEQTKSRFLTYIWYLNDIDKGGHTEFIDGTKIKPEAGKLFLFPSTWTFYHQGTKPLKQTKYICTGWIYVDTIFN